VTPSNTLIIFTITNTVSNQVYVGSTRNDIDHHWETLLIAAESGVEAELYEDIRSSGANCFTFTEWGFAENLSEARELTADAMETFDGKSLQGLITKPKPSKAHRQSAGERKAALALLEEAEQKAQLQGDQKGSTTPVSNPSETDLKLLAQKRDAELEARIARERKETLEMAKVLAKMDSRKRSKTVKAKAKAVKPTSTSATPKLAVGKVASAKQEKLIREKIEQERESREAEKITRQKAEAQEMAEVMSRIDTRAQGMRKTKPKAKPKSAIGSAGSLSLRKTTSPLKETRLELDRDIKLSADISLMQQGNSSTTSGLLLTEKVSSGVRFQEHAGLDKKEKIAHSIARYRNISVPAKSQAAPGKQELISSLQDRLAQRKS
jgi:hypothetical protein